MGIAKVDVYLIFVFVIETNAEQGSFLKFSGYFEPPGTKRTVLCSPGTDEKGT